MAYFKCGSGSSEEFVKKTMNVSLPNLPFDLEEGSAVVHEGEIHVLGGSKFKTNDYAKHIKFNGTEWETVSTLPNRADTNSAVEYHGDIYLIRSNHFYKWDGVTWTELTPPYNSTSSTWKLTVYSDRIYAIGSDSTSAIYYYDGSTWTDTNKSMGSAEYRGRITSGDYIYAVGSVNNSTALTTVTKYDANSNTFTSLTVIPYDSYKSIAECINGELHVLGTLSRTYESVSPNTVYLYNQSFYHYVLRNNVWVRLNDVPHACGGGASVVIDDCICVIGSGVYTYSVSSTTYSGPLTYMFGKNVTIIDKPVYEIAA